MRCPVCGWSDEKKQRSLNQNSYMHGVVFPMIGEEIGEWDYKEVKNLMKKRFLTITREYTSKKGVRIIEEIVRDTRSLNTEEMEKFLADCRHWARDFLKLDIPEPNAEPLKDE